MEAAPASDTVSTVRGIVHPILDALQLELVHLEMGRQSGGLVLRLYIDKPGGVTLDDCAAVSRQVSAQLDVDDPIGVRYTLEVSSPGLDRPLFTLEDFSRFAGRRARVTTTTPLAGQRNFQGLLCGVSGGTVEMTLQNGALVRIPKDMIAKARLELELDVLQRGGASRGRNS